MKHLKLKGKKILSLALAIIMSLGLLTVAPITAYAAETINYIDENSTEQSVSATEITAETGTLTSGWYYSAGTLALGDLTVSGDVKIILTDGSNLTTKGTTNNAGIEVSIGNSLTVYAQSGGTGKLTATGGDYGAGIGGSVGNFDSSGDNCGNITITGGTVTATGGEYGAGIGGGHYGRGGEVTITGGVVTATGGQWSAGIGGGGGHSGRGGKVTITGGAVTATGGQWSAGIGGGVLGSGGEVTITGGAVTATGDGAAGIGGGKNGNGGTVTINGGTVTATGGSTVSGEGGAGIGGGGTGSGGTVTINSGTVTATGANYCAGIGGSSSASGGTVIINGGTVAATGGQYGAGIGGGSSGSGGNVSINGGTVTAIGGQRGAGIGGGSYGNGGTVTITGGSVNAEGQYGSDKIGNGSNGSDSGTLTNGSGADVYLNTLTVGDPSVPNTLITAANISYGIKDVVTDIEGKVYFYLPASAENEEISLTADGAVYSNSYAREANHINAATLTEFTAVETGLRVNGAGPYTDIWDVTLEINEALESGDVTVTGTLSGVTKDELYLVIPIGKTVVWQASLEGSLDNNPLVIIMDGGTFDVAADGSLKNSGRDDTIWVFENTTVKVSGGTVEATGSDAVAISLFGTGAKAEVTGGEVKAVWHGIECDDVGTTVIVSGGIVSSVGSGNAISVTALASTVEISGDAAVTNTVGPAIYLGPSAGPASLVSVKGGTVTGYSHIISGTMHISGGTVSCPDNYAVNLSNSGNIVVSGGTVTSGSAAGPINRYSTLNGAAYYIGDRAGLFNSFTAGTNLFKLDGVPTLTANGGSYTYSNSTPSDYPVVAALSNKLDLTDATVTATAGNPTIDTATNTVIFDKTVYNDVITIAVTGAKVIGTNVPVSFTTAAFGVNVDAGAAGSISYIDENGEGQSALATLITADTEMLFGGWYYAEGTLERDGLTVDGDVKIILTDGSDLTVTGESTVDEEGYYTNNAGINVSEGNSLTVYAQSSGTGKLTATGDQFAAGIGASNSGYTTVGDITIIGGEVTAIGGGSGAGIGGGNYGQGTRENAGTITIAGGAVTATGGFRGAGIGGGEYSFDYVNVTITGGVVTATGGYGATGIGGGYNGDSGAITITGGEVTATGGYESAGISGSTITITGGTITATGSVYYFAYYKEYIYLAGIDGLVTITGGSVKSIRGNGEDNFIDAWEGNLTNGTGADVYLNTLTIGDPAVIETLITAANISYGIKDVVADSEGKVYFYLPASTEDEEIALTADGTVYKNSYTRATNHDNAATLLDTPVTAVDKSALAAKIAEVGNPDGALYTTSTFGAFTGALNGAKAVFADADATQEQVDEAVTALDGAFKALDPRVSVTALSEKVATYTDAYIATLTTSSASTLGGLLTTANGVLTAYNGLVGTDEVTGPYYNYGEIADAGAAAAAFNGLNGFTAAVKATDTTGYTEEWSKANSLTAGSHTIATYNAVKAALAANTLVLDNSTQPQVTAAYNALKAANDGLVEDVDSAAVALALEFAETHTETSYTPDSWAPLADAISAAEALVEGVSLKAEGETAIADIYSAISGLVLLADKSALETAIANAKAYLTNEAYTPASRDALETVIALAQDVYDDANATEAQVSGAIGGLDAGIASLVRYLTADDFNVPGTALIYNGNPQGVTITGIAGIAVTVTYTGLADGEVPTDAGTYSVTIIPTEIGEGLLYAYAGTPFVYEDVLVIGQATPTASDLNYTISDATYDGTAKPVEVEALNGIGDVSVQYSATPVINAGAYTVTANVAESANYTSAAIVLGTLTIGRAALTDDDFSATGLDAVTEDGNAHAVVVTAPNKTGVGAITVLYNGAATAPTLPGEYVITAEVAEGTNYLAYTYSAGTLTIKAKAADLKGLVIVQAEGGFVTGAPWFGAFPNQWIYLTAQPNFGYVFDHYEILGKVAPQYFYNSVSFFMPNDGTGVKVTPVFRKLVLSKINITSDNGFVTGLPFGNSVIEGTPIVLSAIPNFGYVFDGWTIDGVDYTNGWGGSATFTMPANAVNVTANFKALTFYTVTDKTKDGYVTGLPFGGTAIEGTDVYLTPVANFGYQFKEWKVNGVTYNQGFGNSVSFKLTANVTVEAVFEKIPVQPPLFPGFGLPGFGVPGFGLPGYGFPW